MRVDDDEGKKETFKERKEKGDRVCNRYASPIMDMSRGDCISWSIWYAVVPFGGGFFCQKAPVDCYYEGQVQ